MNEIDLKRAALRALHLIDLTSLNDSDSEASIKALAVAADTPAGSPAALCVYPRFVSAAKTALAKIGLQIPVATVTNFPRGEGGVLQAVQETAAAVALGADEVDVVFPWRALLAGDAIAGRELVMQCRAASAGKKLKIIIESGELRDPKLIEFASRIAIDGGADFIKTSTGKVAVNATLAAAEIMLQTIRDSDRVVGFKAAGGVRNASEAAAYLALADRVMGEDWAQPATFRFGASSLLGNLLATLGYPVGATRSTSY